MKAGILQIGVVDKTLTDYVNIIGGVNCKIIIAIIDVIFGETFFICQCES